MNVWLFLELRFTFEEREPITEDTNSAWYSVIRTTHIKIICIVVCLPETTENSKDIWNFILANRWLFFRHWHGLTLTLGASLTPGITTVVLAWPARLQLLTAMWMENKFTFTKPLLVYVAMRFTLIFFFKIFFLDATVLHRREHFRC